MTKNIKTFTIMIACISVLTVSVFHVVVYSNRYLPLSELLYEMDDIRSLSCIKIELDYPDLTSKGKGEAKKKTLTEKNEIQSMINIFLQTFCHKSQSEER